MSNTKYGNIKNYKLSAFRAVTGVTPETFGATILYYRGAKLGFGGGHNSISGGHNSF